MADEQPVEIANNANHNPNVGLPPVMQNVPLPGRLELSGNLAKNWNMFLRTWQNYEIASRLELQPVPVRTATLLTCIGHEAMHIFEGFSFEEGQNKDIAIVLRKFEAYCVGNTNETYERYLFNKRDQEISESFDAWFSQLSSLIKTCNFGELSDSLLRDRVVVGHKDNHVRKRLLQEEHLTLRKCVDICRAAESVSVRVKVMNLGDNITAEEVSHVRHKTKGKYKQKPNKIRQTPAGETTNCKYCGGRHELNREACPAKSEVCRNCMQTGHYAKKCGKFKRKLKHRIHTIDQASDSDSSVDLLLSLTEKNTSSNSEEVNSVGLPKRLNAELKIGKEMTIFQLDCGATCNALPVDLYKRVCKDANLVKLLPSNTKLQLFDPSSQIQPFGKTRIKVVNPVTGVRYSLEFQIVPNCCRPILGCPAILGMELIKVNSDKFKIENIRSLQSETPLTLTDIREQYKDVFTGQGLLKGEYHFEIDESVSPVQLPPRRVPISMKEPLKDELARLTAEGIITPVSEPTEWVSSMVITHKSNGKIRLCLDPRPLNKALKCGKYPMATIEDILPDLANARVFTIADVKDGFWHIKLDDRSSMLTTFATPWGRYRWLRLPFGVAPAPEEFQRRLNESLEGLPGVKAIADDILIWGIGETDQEADIDHDKKMRLFLDRCQECNIKLNAEKLKYKEDSVPYIGHLITKHGLKPDPAKITAIAEMPPPTDKGGVQRLMGMLNYLQKFAPDLSTVTAPIRSLLKEENEFYWDPEIQGRCLTEIKDIITKAPTLRYFDSQLPVVVQCDASQGGLGATLLQSDQPVAYASRALTDTEQRYAHIEKELLAIVFALEKFETYVYGRKVIVESDHKPLQSIQKKSLLSAPKRLQRMLLRLQKFDYEIVFKPGTQLYIADTLSRAYPKFNGGYTENRDQEVIMSMDSNQKDIESINMVDYLCVTEGTVMEIRHGTRNDPVLGKLMTVIQKGWPETRNEVQPEIQCYFNFREELVVQDGLVFKGERLVIPKNTRQSILEKLHSSHLGIQSTIRIAREVVFWPLMAVDIERHIKTCGACKTFQPEQRREPMIAHEIPDLPWDQVGIDFFECNGKHYIVCVDYYSDFFEVDRMSSLTSKYVIRTVKSYFARHGIPRKVITDNGPPFNSEEFQSFSDVYGFEHVTSSPLYAQSNGKSESAVKSAKKLIQKTKESKTDSFLALLELRNTPTEGINSSPVQRLFGRRTRGIIPTANRLLKPSIVPNVKTKLKQRKAKQTIYYDKGTRELPTLSPGETVWVKSTKARNRWVKATVETQADIRSYIIRTADGRIYRRNRRQLRSDGFENSESILPRPIISRNPTTNSHTEPNIDNSKPVVSVNPVCEKLAQTSPPVVEKSTVKSASKTVYRTVNRKPESQSEQPVNTTRSGRVVRKPLFSDYVYQ